MANKELSEALPIAEGLRVAVVPLDNNAFYPEAQPPIPAPCLVFVYDNGFLQHSYMYVDLGGTVVALESGFYQGGS